MEEMSLNIITESLKKAVSYGQYRLLVGELVTVGSTSGPDKSETMINYTKLNHSRMNRLDKILSVTEEELAQLNEFKKEVIWLVITESWCGDAAQNLPVINLLASNSENIDLKIVLRDENPELMNLFLTNGAMAIPKLIMLDKHSLEVMGTWGPRPTEATRMVEEFKDKHGKLTAEFKEQLQLWYNKMKGADTIKDLLELLSLELVGDRA